MGFITLLSAPNKNSILGPFAVLDATKDFDWRAPPLDNVCRQGNGRKHRRLDALVSVPKLMFITCISDACSLCSRTSGV